MLYVSTEVDHTSTQATIVICDACGGYGIVHGRHEEGTCITCGGNGKLRKIINIKYERVE